ncbi:MAG TPA: hypothetical protein VFN56_00825 [Candidatus Saccharimonadales bacterium]|nr:hypothetical protein [Candidatus Saccharimonadales bacterium]
MNVQAEFAKMQHHIVTLSVIFFGLIVFFILFRYIKNKRPQKLDHEEFHERWQELQKQCSSKNTWPLAIIDADKLLDDALKKKRYKGKTMGERLVSAQRVFSDNEMLWFGHKLCNKLLNDDYKLTRKTDVKDALLGYLQALKDIGALKNDK